MQKKTRFIALFLGLMMLMSLGVKQGDTVTVSVDGADEDAAVAALKEFFENNL